MNCMKSSFLAFGAVLLVAGCIEYVAKIDRLAQARLDPLHQRGIRVLAFGHR